MKLVTKTATPNEVIYARMHCRLRKMEWSVLLLFVLAADGIVVTVAWYILNNA